jgi:hypothetical protein
MAGATLLGIAIAPDWRNAHFEFSQRRDSKVPGRNIGFVARPTRTLKATQCCMKVFTDQDAKSIRWMPWR